MTWKKTLSLDMSPRILAFNHRLHFVLSMSLNPTIPLVLSMSLNPTIPQER